MEGILSTKEEMQGIKYLSEGGLVVDDIKSYSFNIKMKGLVALQTVLKEKSAYKTIKL